jgi:hypothetical protein
MIAAVDTNEGISKVGEMPQRIIARCPQGVFSIWIFSVLSKKRQSPAVYAWGVVTNEASFFNRKNTNYERNQ